MLSALDKPAYKGLQSAHMVGARRITHFIRTKGVGVRFPTCVCCLQLSQSVRLYVVHRARVYSSKLTSHVLRRLQQSYYYPLSGYPVIMMM